MDDYTKEYFEYLRRIDVIRREIVVCDSLISDGASEDANVVQAEKTALQAELDYIEARFKVELALRSMAEAAQDFAQRPSVPKGEDWHEFIQAKSTDYDDYLVWFNEYLMSRNPSGSVRDLTEKQDAAREREMYWLQSLKRWDEEHTRNATRAESVVPEGGEVISLEVVKGKIRVRLLLADGSWAYADGAALLPSGIYVRQKHDWTAILDELEALVNDAHVLERDLQEFFEIHPQLLRGSDYRVVVPQARIIRNEGPNWLADFVLVPHDQIAFARVLEIKSPWIQIEGHPRADHAHFYADLHQALQQVLDYAEALADARVAKRFSEHYGLEIYRPDAQLILGRRNHIRSLQRLVDIQKRSSVHIVDWDTCIERLRRQYGK